MFCSKKKFTIMVLVVILLTIWTTAAFAEICAFIIDPRHGTAQGPVICRATLVVSYGPWAGTEPGHPDGDQARVVTIKCPANSAHRYETIWEYK